MKKYLAILTAFMLSNAGAGPVPDDQRVDIDLRRTTLIVEDIDKSLSFYRDALGMEVIYDNMIRNPRDAKSDAEAELARRLVFVRANDDYIGIIGLLEYTKPRRPVRGREPQPFSSGSAVLLFTAKDVRKIFARAAAIPGVEVLSEPALTSYPSYDGMGAIPVITSTLYDPDGFLIELNEFPEG